MSSQTTRTHSTYCQVKEASMERLRTVQPLERTNCEETSGRQGFSGGRRRDEHGGHRELSGQVILYDIAMVSICHSAFNNTYRILHYRK